MFIHTTFLTLVVFAAMTSAAEKQIKLDDIERDNLRNSKDQGKPQQQQPQAPALSGQPEVQQYLHLSPNQQQLLAQQLQQQAYLLPSGGQFAYYPALPAFQGNQVGGLQTAYVTPDQVQALAAQYQQAVPQQAYLTGLNNFQYVPATFASQYPQDQKLFQQVRSQELKLQQESAALQAQPSPKYNQQELPAQQLLQYVQPQQAGPQQQYVQQFQTQESSRVPSNLQTHVPPPLSSAPEAPEPTIQYSSGEVYSTIPYSSKQDYSVHLTNPPRQQQQQQQQYILQQQFQQSPPPRPYNPYNALLHSQQQQQQQQQQQKTLFAAGAKSTVSPPVKSLPSGGFLPSASINHPGQGFSFSNYRRGPPGNF